MFENLSEKLEAAFRQIRGESRITDLNVANTVKDIRRALVDADVNYRVAKEFTDRVREKAIGQRVIQSVSPGQLLVKIVQDELASLMGGSQRDLDLQGNPAVILVVGLQGSGKTTFCGKLANHLKNRRGRSPLLAAADVYRPAAMEQLRVLSEQVGVDLFLEPGSTDPVDIARKAVATARSRNRNVVIVDTAGRLAVDQAMMAEVAAIRDAVEPREILFVADAMTGQDAVNTARAFHDRLALTGVVLTKLDGDARGGAALSIRHTVDVPVKFVSNGEKMDALDVFHPDRMAQRILGMGDITSLVEKAQQQYDGEQARRLEKKIRKNQFDFQDFLDQLQQIRKMGSLKDIMGMIPGAGKALKGVDISDDAFKGVEAIIRSMTPTERADPALINTSRKKRIARGSGKDISEVNQFMKQFDQMRQMMRSMQKMPPGMRMGPGRR